MKFIFTILVFCFLSLTANAQVTVYIHSGNFTNNTPEKNPSNDNAFFSENIYNNKYFLWLQFNELPTENKKNELIQYGVKLYEYLPKNTYIASFPTNFNFNILRQYNVYAVTKQSPASKIDAQLFSPSKINWAVPASGKLKVNISFSDEVAIDVFLQSLLTKGIEFTKIEDKLKDVVVVETTIDEIKKIATHPLVNYIEPCSAPGVVEDIQGVSDHRASTVQSSDNWVTGKKLNGKGVVLAVGDDGFIGPHIDFKGRILVNATNMAAANTHADHVCGIVTGAGNYNPLVVGQASGADLRVYDGYAPYTRFPGIYTDDLVRVISHSLGQTCNAGYTADARTSDQLIRLYPNLMYVHSAGNSGTSACGGLTGFRNITGGYKAGKNVLTVANLTKSDVISSSSSRGPLSDGRIKPDIAAVGSSVNSTQPDNTFALNSGTSMSCPAINGIVGILMQSYKNKNANAQPEGSLIKAVMLNTADDLGNEGPDFSYGWGRVNARKAVNCIENGRYFSDEVTTGVTKNHTITIPANVSKAKVMVYWGDREAGSGATFALVNNIDAKIVRNTIEYLPWVLDIGTTPTEASCLETAIKGKDSLNNMEQIQLDNPVAGTYDLTVFGKAIPFGPQKYYVVYEFDYIDEIVVTYPFGGESFSPNESQRIRWDASAGFGNFVVDYSLDGGNSFTIISSNVASDLRFLDWSVPSSATSRNARIRVSRNTATDWSDTTFVIIRIPSGLTFSDVYQGTSNLTWNAVTGATAYDVFRLGTKYMDLVGTTTTPNFTLNNLGDTLNWFAVRAKMATAQANGRRSIAVSYKNNSLIPNPVPVKLISFTATYKNNNVQLDWTVGSEIGMLNYVVEKSNNYNFDIVETVGQLAPTNQSSIHNYKLIDKNISSNATIYYRLKMVESGKISYSNIQVVKLDKLFSTEFLVSPNPSINVINLQSQTEVKNAVVRVFNELGKEVLIAKFSNIKVGDKQSIQTNFLVSGNYFLSIFNADNGAIIYKQQISIIK